MINDMFSIEPNLESIEPKGWDINLEDCEVDCKGELWSTLEDMNGSRKLNMKYEYMLEKSKRQLSN